MEILVTEVAGHPAPGAQRPDVRAGRTALLHRPRRLPPERPQARARLRAERRRERASCSTSCRPPTRTGSSPSRTGASSGSSRTTVASTASRPGGTSEKIHQLPDGHIPDGLKVDADGNLWITTFMSGGVDIVRPDGTALDFLETGGVPAQLHLPRGRPVHHRLRRDHRGHRSGADGRAPVARVGRGRGDAAVPGSIGSPARAARRRGLRAPVALAGASGGPTLAAPWGLEPVPRRIEHGVAGRPRHPSRSAHETMASLTLGRPSAGIESDFPQPRQRSSSRVLDQPPGTPGPWLGRSTRAAGAVGPRARGRYGSHAIACRMAITQARRTQSA